MEIEYEVQPILEITVHPVTLDAIREVRINPAEKRLYVTSLIYGGKNDGGYATRHYEKDTRGFWREIPLVVNE